jgi:DNA-binding MarR family transcriptional regulator
MNLRQAARVVTGYFDEQLKSTGLRVTQLNLLMAIEVATPLTMTGLAEILAMDRTTLTRNLKLLRRRNLVEPTRIALTQKGRRAAADAIPIWERAQAQVTSTLGDKRWERMLVELAATRAAVRSIPGGRVRRLG